MEALNDYVLIEDVPQTTTTPGGIELPDNVGVESCQVTEGVIISIGPTVKNRDLSVGETIFYQHYQQIDINDNLVAVKEDNIICKE